MFAFIALAIVLQSCEPDSYTSYMVSDYASEGRTSVRLDLEGLEATKTPMLAGSEQIFSGAMVCVMLHSSGMMDSVQNISPDGVADISVPIGQAIDIYVLGNLWALGPDSSKASLAEAMGADFPCDRESLESMPYLLDGGVIAPGWRRETLSDVSRFGIPFSGILENIQVRPDESLGIVCRRMFSRVTLTVDHSGLDNSPDDSWFVNGSVHVRQANGRLAPFSALPQKATSKGDVIEGDYDAEMENGRCLTFTFYVPENMQGDVLPSNDDPMAKSLEQVQAAVGDEAAALLTYIEFAGSISKDAGGYGGDVVYRFYLGGDNCSNFDLQRGRDYDVRLGFRVNSIFDPWWQVNVEGGLDDGRKFCLTSDAAFMDALPDNQMVAVRKSRPAKAYVYMNRSGQMGDNQLRGRPVADPDARMEDLSDCAWTSDFLSALNSASQVPMRSKLQELGIEASFDATSGALEFSVVEPSRFVAGKEIPLEMRLLPGNRTIHLRLCTFEDMSVSWDKSPSEDFFMGMTRTASLNGFCGGVSVTSEKDAVLKTSASDSDAFLSGAAQAVPPGNQLKLYAWDESAGNFRLMLMPTDIFNDGDSPIDVQVRLEKPYLYLLTQSLDVYVCVSGNNEQVNAVYCRRDEYTDESMMRITEFDEQLYSRLLDFGYQFGISPTQSEHDAFDATFAVIRNKTTFSEGGYRYTWLARKALSPSVSPGCIPAVASGQPQNYELRAVSRCGIVSRNCRNLQLLPLLNSSSSVSFAPSYHDFSLMDTRFLDEPYRSYQTSFLAEGHGQIYEDLPSDCLEAYAVPLEPGSEGYAAGRSESVRIDFSSGHVTMSFVDDGVSTRHSVGLHDIKLGVVNRHSGERMEAVLGQLKVYVDFVIGLDLEMEYQTRDKAAFTVWPVLMSAVRRTTCADWFSSFGVAVEDAGQQDLVYDYLDTFTNNWVNVARGSKTYGSLSFAHYEQPFYTLYSVELDREADYEGVELDEIDERKYMEHFDAGIWLDDIGGNPQTTVNVVVYGMKDDAAGGLGYYCFHRLQDLSVSSKGWVGRLK